MAAVKQKQKLKSHEIAFLSSMALALFFVYNHYWKTSHAMKLAALNNELARVNEEALNDQKLLDKLLSTNRNPADLALQTSKDLLDKYAKSNDHFSKVMMQLSDKAGTPFSLTRFATENQTKVGPYTKTSISLEAQATFLTIGRFLETLDDSPLLTEVESIEIKRVSTDLKLCNAKIRIFSYVAEP
jgi:hypothetical protein